MERGGRRGAHAGQGEELRGVRPATHRHEVAQEVEEQSCKENLLQGAHPQLTLETLESTSPDSKLFIECEGSMEGIINQVEKKLAKDVASLISVIRNRIRYNL